jgi:hypothetical protein
MRKDNGMEIRNETAIEQLNDDEMSLKDDKTSYETLRWRVIMNKLL